MLNSAPEIGSVTFIRHDDILYMKETSWPEYIEVSVALLELAPHHPPAVLSDFSTQSALYVEDDILRFEVKNASAIYKLTEYEPRVMYDIPTKVYKLIDGTVFPFLR